MIVMRKNKKNEIEEEYEYISFLELKNLAFCLKCNSCLSSCHNYYEHLATNQIIIHFKKIEEVIDEF